ncbi:hypothetical protein AGLY_015501, partial [Aphis glycines]
HFVNYWFQQNVLIINSLKSTSGTFTLAIIPTHSIMHSISFNILTEQKVSNLALQLTVVNFFHLNIIFQTGILHHEHFGNLMLIKSKSVLVLSNRRHNNLIMPLRTTFSSIVLSIVKFLCLIFNICFTFSKDAECLRLSLLVLALIGIWLRIILDVIGALRGTGNLEEKQRNILIIFELSSKLLRYSSRRTLAKALMLNEFANSKLNALHHIVLFRVLSYIYVLLLLLMLYNLFSIFTKDKCVQFIIYYNGRFCWMCIYSSRSNSSV